MLNLTPHAIGVIDGVDGETIHQIPASGQVARVETRAVLQGTLGLPGGVILPVTSTSYGDVTGIPAPGGEKFLVSSLVLDRLGPEYRGQAFAPDTGPTAVRKDGQIVAVRQFRTV
jgi:hypothetical protein